MIQLPDFGSPWLNAAAVIISVMILAKVVGSIAKLILNHAAKIRKVDPKGMKLNRFEINIMIAIILWGVKITLGQFGYTSETSPIGLGILTSIIVLNIGQLLIGVIRIAIELVVHPIVHGTESKVDDQIVSLLHKASTAVVYILAVIYILTIWNVEIAPLLASLGIAGLAVALALQPILGNIFSGIAMFLDKTFTLGDIVKLESGESGTIFDMGLRTTRVKTWDGEIIIIPNSNLANSQILNYNQPSREARTTFEFGVEYGVDPEYIKKITMEEIKKVEMLDHDKDILIMFKGMDDSALTFKVMYWVKDISDKWPANQEGLSRVYRRLYKEDIGIPFPQQTVWLRDEGKAKSPSPFSRKFASTNDTYLSAMGRPWEKKAPEAKPKKKRVISGKNLIQKARKGIKKGLKKK